MPACADQELLLGGMVDGELDAANVAMVEAHVARCKDCREELERLLALRTLFNAQGVRHTAPATLSKSIAAMPEFSTKAANENKALRWLAPGLTGAVAASLAILTLAPLTASSPVDRELISSHVRSLQPGHLTDVQTTNQHVVKPWFNGTR